VDSVLVDSSAWIHLLSEGNRSKLVEKEINRAKKVYVPSLVVFEVYRKIAKSLDEMSALRVVGQLSQYENLDLNREIALTGADFSIEFKLPMADSLIAAHAYHCGAQILTLDNDFRCFDFAKIIN
jgi:predicted nucleic acid-binding protein